MESDRAHFPGFPSARGQGTFLLNFLFASSKPVKQLSSYVPSLSSYVPSLLYGGVSQIDQLEFGFFAEGELDGLLVGLGLLRIALFIVFFISFKITNNQRSIRRSIQNIHETAHHRTFHLIEKRHLAAD